MSIPVAPNERIWAKVYPTVAGENLGEVLATVLAGLAGLLTAAGIVPDNRTGRAHLAAMLISPDEVAERGSLLPQLHQELQRLSGADDLADLAAAAAKGGQA